MNSLVARTVLGLTIALATTLGQAQHVNGPSHGPATTAKVVPGYLIANFTIRDQATFQKYRDAVRPLTRKYKGKAIENFPAWTMSSASTFRLSTPR